MKAHTITPRYSRYKPVKEHKVTTESERYKLNVREIKGEHTLKVTC